MKTLLLVCLFVGCMLWKFGLLKTYVVAIFAVAPWTFFALSALGIFQGVMG